MEKETSQFPDLPGYTIERVLGKGGMATVYLAVQKTLSRQVALKVMNPILVLDEDFRRRFLNEGRLIARLSHPNIVTVYNIGTAEGSDYLSMTYLPGGTLQQKLRAGLSPDQVVNILATLADALGYAHRQGIVHRDIKPGNVLFTKASVPVLTDFGIAKNIGSDTQLTCTGVTIGSAKYMSPEQALGLEVDNRSDLYSLGVVFWLMLTGDLPYQAQDPFALALKHAREPIPDLPEHLRRFQPIVQRLLAKQPEDRFSNAEELLDTLGDAPSNDLNETRIWDDGATAIVPNSSTRAKFAQTQEAKVEPPQHATSKRIGWVLPALGSLTVLGGIGAFISFSGLLSSHESGEKSIQKTIPIETYSSGEAPAQDHISRTDTNTTLAVQEASPDSPASRSREATGRVATGADATGMDDLDSRIEKLLITAERQWQAGRLTDPVGDNAFESYRSILELDPGHPQAREKLVTIGRINAANKIFLSADQLLRQGKIEDARRMIETGLKMNPDDKRLLGLRNALD